MVKDSLLEELTRNDWYEKLGASLEERGWRIDPATGRYSIAGKMAISKDCPWIFLNPKPELEDVGCTVYWAIVDHLGVIPTHCVNCWKVVVQMFHVKDAFAVYDWMKKYVDGFIGKDRFCKIGMEERAYTYYNYGAYFYCNSKEQGLERWEDVRRAVANINPNINVVLKHYCTEYEINLGPSDLVMAKQEPLTEHIQVLEEKLFERIDISSIGANSGQPSDLKDHILRKWLEFAYKIGDPTVLGFNKGVPFYSQPITYHPGGTYEKRQQGQKETNNAKS